LIDTVAFKEDLIQCLTSGSYGFICLSYLIS